MLPEELEGLAAAERQKQQGVRHRVQVCQGTACLSNQSDKLTSVLEEEVRKRDMGTDCKVKRVGCMGLCANGPMVMHEKEGASALYQNVAATDAADIIDSLNRSPVERLRCDMNIPFFSRQMLIVRENSGRIDPERIEDYIACDGYKALLAALAQAQPAQVIEQIVRSGLRGRGGAGYPTGLKWTTVAKAGGDRKYVICNADEGDPGAFMDRSVMEADPHRVLEGMALAGYAVGAQQGFVYIRAEYPLAVKRLKTAIRQAESLKLLGNRIAGTDFNFTVDIRLGAGAFVCGEETALIGSIEGKRGNPKPRPPYPAQEGLWGCPTLINNVETFANVPPILRKGGDWFAGIGTEKSKGTKIFALAGRIKHSGLIEVPMGMSLREIVYDIGGGSPDGHACKAVQTGGPSGGCIPADHFDTPVDYESLTALGSIMGSGGMIVMDDSSCMVDVARFFMEFCRGESCGKCVPCRVGTVHMHELLTKLAGGNGTMKDIAFLEELCDLVKQTSLCGLGQTAPNPVLSTLRYFREEYRAHIVEKRCPAGQCKMAEPAANGGASHP